MSARKGFTGTPGRPSMKARGWDGTTIGKQRIEDLRVPKDGTWSMVAAAAACDRSLAQVSAFTVLAMLGKYRNPKTGECFPSALRLSRDLGISRRSVQRHLDRLVERGYLVVVPRRVRASGGGSRQTSNAYVMLFPPMPASPEGDEGIEDGSTPIPTQNPPSEAPRPNATSATPSVAAESAGTPPEGQIEASPLRHLMATPATDAGNPCDTICRTNDPTSNDPSKNDPFAEANARTRARAAAAADEGDGENGTGKPSTEPGAPAQPEARQDMPRIKGRDMRPPPPPRDPVGGVVRSLAKITGTAEGILWGDALRWHTDLQGAGFSDADAVTVIAKIGAAAMRDPATARYALAEIEAGIRTSIDAQRLGAAA